MTDTTKTTEATRRPCPLCGFERREDCALCGNWIPELTNKNPQTTPSFIGTRPGISLVAIKFPIFFKRWIAKLGFTKAYEAPYAISSLCGYEGNVFAACHNMVFKLDKDGVMRPLRFEVEHEQN